MIRLIVRAFIALVAAAVGLIVASLVFGDFDINASGFIDAVVIFTLVYVLFTPFLASQFRRSNSAGSGAVALIATLAALIVTDLISDGLNISGIGTWIAVDRDRLGLHGAGGLHPSVPGPEEVPRRTPGLGAVPVSGSL